MNAKQVDEAQKAMISWLSDPHELGKAPSKIELAGEFELHEMRYYIFKYKKSVLGKWLLGVCGGYEDEDLNHCGHIFSEMQEYDEKTAIDDAIKMVEMIRAYWIERARQFSDSSEDQ